LTAVQLFIIILISGTAAWKGAEGSGVTSYRRTDLSATVSMLQPVEYR